MPAAWQHSRDRVAALDGAVNVHRTDSGMTVTAVIPLDPEQSHEPARPPTARPARPAPPLMSLVKSDTRHPAARLRPPPAHPLPQWSPGPAMEVVTSVGAGGGPSSPAGAAWIARGRPDLPRIGAPRARTDGAALTTACRMFSLWVPTST